MHLLFSLPTDIQKLIWSYDSTFRDRYNKVMEEIKENVDLSTFDNRINFPFTPSRIRLQNIDLNSNNLNLKIAKIMINSTRSFEGSMTRVTVGQGLGGKALIALNDIDKMLLNIDSQLARQLAQQRKRFWSRRRRPRYPQWNNRYDMEADLKRRETLFKNIIKNDKLRIHINSEEERKKIIKTFFTFHDYAKYPNSWIEKNGSFNVKSYSSKVQRAIKNYEEFRIQFYSWFIPGSVTVEEVEMSSAGIDGWANYQPSYRME